jgi:hypothetical protein
VLITPESYVCEPGSGRGVDSLRLAYLLGLLVDGFPYEDPPTGPHGTRREHVERIFADDAFIREIRLASETLRARRWIHEAGFAALSEEGILRPSPWHVDHVHVRFTGEPGRSLFDDVHDSTGHENE